MREILTKHGLAMVWESASAFAEHARFAAIVGSSSFTTIEKDGRAISQIWIGFHEGGDLDEPSLLLRVLNLLRTQERVLRLLLSALPEVTDPITIDGRLPRFTAKLDGLFAKFNRSYPEFAENARRWKP